MWLCGVATMDLSEARGLVLFRVVREGIGISRRLSANGTLCAYRRLGCSPSNPSVSRTNRPPPEKKSPKMERALHRRRSSGLRFQFLKVEVFSLLPQSQRNGCNLTREGQTHHGRLDAFGQRSLVKILKRSGLYTRPGRGSFEQTFQIVIVILVQSSDGDLLFRALQLASDVAMFTAGTGFQGQSAVGPKLSLGAKTMRSLDQ